MQGWCLVLINEIPPEPGGSNKESYREVSAWTDLSAFQRRGLSALVRHWENTDR